MWEKRRGKISAAQLTEYDSRGGGNVVTRWLGRKSKPIDPIPWRFNIRCARPWGKEQKKGYENRKFIKRFGRTKALSQCWTAVCDRHPWGRYGCRRSNWNIKEEIKLKTDKHLKGGEGGARKEKNIWISATLAGCCSRRCFFRNGTHTVCFLDADSVRDVSDTTQILLFFYFVRAPLLTPLKVNAGFSTPDGGSLGSVAHFNTAIFACKR